MAESYDNSSTTTSRDLIYSPIRRDDSDSAIKIAHLQELIQALDGLALKTHSGVNVYPSWILDDVKSLYQLLRATFDQVSSGGRVLTTRDDIVGRLHKIRTGLSELSTTTTRTYRSRSPSPKRLTHLFEHIPGSQYCRKFFHTQKEHGRQYHTPGPPNPSDTAHDHSSRRWLKETWLETIRPRHRHKTRRRQSKTTTKLELLLDRTDQLESRLQDELRRELRTEQFLGKLREEDRLGFQRMLDKLDYLGECILCNRSTDTGRRSPSPPDPPPPTTRVVVDHARIDDLERELNKANSQAINDLAVKEGRISSLNQELLEARRQVDELRRAKLELENELAQNRANDAVANGNQQQLQERIQRLEESLKKHCRAEKRLERHEKELNDEIADLQQQLGDLRTALARSKQREDDLIAERARAPAVPEPIPTKPEPVQQNRFHRVVISALFRHFLDKFRKESKARADLQSTLSSVSSALERAQQLHRLELDSIRSQSLLDTNALIDARDRQAIDNDRLQDQLARAQSEHAELERRFTTTLELTKRKSVEEIAALQMQLMVVDQSKVIEPPVDLNAFNKMAGDAFQGDYLHLADAPSVLHIMFEHGDERVLFSDRIEKLNHRNFREKRILMIGQHSIYLLMVKGMEVKRVMKVEDIDKVTMSRRCADHLVIHHRSEEDIFLISSKRFEIMYFLMNAFKRKTSTDIKYHFAERFYVEDRDMHYRLVEIPDTTTVKLGKSVVLGPT